MFGRFTGQCDGRGMQFVTRLATQGLPNRHPNFCLSNQGSVCFARLGSPIAPVVNVKGKESET